MVVMKKIRNRIDMDLIRKVRRLRKQCDAELSRRGSMSTNSTVEVSYFAVIDLIEYFDETREAASRVVIARDALHQVFFSSAERISV